MENKKILVLAEKPSVARDYARVLNCQEKRKGYFQGRDHIVTWALGHLVTLAEPEKYNPRFREWKMEDLPMLPEKMKLKIIGKSAHQFKTIQSLLHRKDVDRLVIATDAGREGELVARWIMLLGGWKKPAFRLWISSQTDAAIRQGFARLKPGREYERLFKAAVCRAEADWLIGLNTSRALTCRFNARLTAGRVQTPTLWMIVAREKEISEFTPREYWNLTADFTEFQAVFQEKSGNRRLYDRQQAEQLRRELTDSEFTLEKITVTRKTRPAPQAYDLTELQRDANRRYGFSAKHTLALTQSLYETHKLVTYPRTDSRHITTDMVPTLKARLRAIPAKTFSRWTEPLLKQGLNPGRNLVNNAGVSDHHAIIPTETAAEKVALTVDEQKIYNLIARRFITVLYPPHVFQQINWQIRSRNQLFVARGEKTLQPGWHNVTSPFFSREEEPEDRLLKQNLPDFARGRTLKKPDLKLKSRKTSPPAPYTEATLLTAMENPAVFVADKTNKDTLKNAGLGTPATRAEIIEKLLNHHYLERRGKQLLPTSTGRQLIDLVPESLKSPALTARWEQQLSQIEKGAGSSREFMKKIRENTAELVQAVKHSGGEFKLDNLSRTKCPLCGRFMQKVVLRREKMLVCPEPSCGHSQPEKPFQAEELHGGKRRRKGSSRHLIDRYTDHNKKAGSLGDLLDSALKKKS